MKKEKKNYGFMLGDDICYIYGTGSFLWVQRKSELEKSRNSENYYWPSPLKLPLSDVIKLLRKQNFHVEKKSRYTHLSLVTEDDDG